MSSPLGVERLFFGEPRLDLFFYRDQVTYLMCAMTHEGKIFGGPPRLLN